MGRRLNGTVPLQPLAAADGGRDGAAAAAMPSCDDGGDSDVVGMLLKLHVVRRCRHRVLGC